MTGEQVISTSRMTTGGQYFVYAVKNTLSEYVIRMTLDGFDTLYTDYWAEALHLDQQAQQRFDFYRLFYSVAFMRKHSTQKNHRKVLMFDTERLNRMFKLALNRIDNNI